MTKRKVVLIIQARMGSTRLPGKSMMDLAGAPLVGRILERVKRSRLVNQIVLAIPDTPENFVLADLAMHYEVETFSGSENDVLDRYFRAALKYQAELVVRLPADNATPEPEEIDRIVRHHLDLGRPGFSSNLSVIDNSGYPDGIGGEIFDFELLDRARYSADESQREHVHLNFYNYQTGIAVDDKLCPISTVVCPEEFRRPDLILDVNTKEQYEFMLKLYAALYHKNDKFHITDIINWYDNSYCLYGY